MNGTYIALQDNAWYTGCYNTQINYRVAGTDEAAQRVNIRLLAQDMQAGQATLEQNIATRLVTNGEHPHITVEALYGSETKLTTESSTFIAVEGDSLIDEIPDLGAWLLPLF